MNYRSSSADKQFMERALSLALQAKGQTSPNPLVGCVIVKDNKIIGEGYHARAGTPHAEINALQAAGNEAKGADVYVTLEPCSHHGRTPPCTEALIKAGVKNVIIAMLDPNPLVNGRGVRALQDAGISVETGLLTEQAQMINEPFIKAITRKLPFILYKCALTLDGKTAVSSGDSRWITSEQSRKYSHYLRSIYDVIMVGSQTVLNDNPLLNCRLEKGRDPVKLIVDGTLSLPPDSQVLSSSASPCIIAVTQTADRNKIAWLKENKNVEIWQYPTPRYVPLRTLVQDIVSRGLNSILLEGGGILAGKMLEEKLIDKIEFIYAPKLAGSGPSPLSGFQLLKMADAVTIRNMEIVQQAEDFIVSGYVSYMPENSTGSDV
jgi:diaminohydroxyphosphoribosylaminopyrimidine deaminase/5-amino-6-(5-phosphoribosylamino)uracil reductase